MSKALSKSLIINTFWSFIGRFGYLSVGLVSNIILARLLSPKEFGQLGIVMFFIVIGNVLTESGLSGALVRKKEVSNIDYSTMFVFNLLISVLLIIVIAFFSGPVAEFYNDTELQILLIASSFTLLINALRITQNTKLVRELEFKKKATYEFFAILIASLIAVMLAIYGAGVWSLIALQLLISAISTIFFWVFVGRIKTYQFSMESFKSLYKFGINTTAASLLNTGFDNLYQLVLGKYFSISQAGYYYQAKNLQGITSNIVIMLSSGPIYAVLSKLQDDNKEFNDTYDNITRTFTVFVGLISTIIFIYTELIITTLYGNEWLESAFYMKLLIIASFFYIQEMFSRNIFKIFDKTERILQLEVAKKLFQLLTVFYGIYTTSINNLLYGLILTNVLSFLANYYFSKKIQRKSNNKELIDVIKVVIISAIIIISETYFEKVVGMREYQVLWLLPFITFTFLISLGLFKVINFKADIKNISSIIRNKL